MGLIRSPHRRHRHRRICEKLPGDFVLDDFHLPSLRQISVARLAKSLIIIVACLLFVSLLLVLELI